MGYVEKDRPRRPKPAATPRPDRTEQAYLTQGGQGATCRACGATLTFTFPMPLRAFADTLKAFADLHRGCRAQPAEVPHGEA